MRPISPSIAIPGLLFCLSLLGQQSAISQQAAPSTAKAKPARTSLFLQASSLDLSLLIAHPPANDSSVTKEELKQLHEIENNRTDKQTAAAKADDLEEDIFVYRDIFGSGFTPENLPVLTALSTDVHNEEGVATAPLKKDFARQRPYQLDHTLHPVCKTTTDPNSYPSGHTLSGYLLGYTLAYIAPEKKDLILARTDEYAHNRLVCGVHYPSDLEASRNLASAMFGAMTLNPVFQQRVAAARQELRTRFASAR